MQKKLVEDSKKLKEDSMELKKNLSYIYNILSECVDDSLHPVKKLTADFIAEYALIQLQNFYTNKYIVSEVATTESINNKIMKSRKEAVKSFKDDKLFMEIYADLKEGGLL